MVGGVGYSLSVSATNLAPEPWLSMNSVFLGLMQFLRICRKIKGRHKYKESYPTIPYVQSIPLMRQFEIFSRDTVP